MCFRRDATIVPTPNDMAIALKAIEDGNVTHIEVPSHLTDNEVEALAFALKSSRSVIEFKSFPHDVGAAARHAIAQALKKNKSLTEVNVKWKVIGDEGEAVASVLSENNTLTKLHML